MDEIVPNNVSTCRIHFIRSKEQVFSYSLYKTAKSATSAMNHLLRLVKWHTVADKILLNPTTNIIHNRTEGVTYEYTGIIKSIT